MCTQKACTVTAQLGACHQHLKYWSALLISKLILIWMVCGFLLLGGFNANIAEQRCCGRFETQTEPLIDKKALSNPKVHLKISKWHFEDCKVLCLQKNSSSCRRMTCVMHLIQSICLLPFLVPSFLCYLYLDIRGKLCFACPCSAASLCPCSFSAFFLFLRAVKGVNGPAFRIILSFLVFSSIRPERKEWKSRERTVQKTSSSRRISYRKSEQGGRQREKITQSRDFGVEKIMWWDGQDAR